MKDRYGLLLPNGRWVSIKDKPHMLTSHWGTGVGRKRAPKPYTNTNIFKVLRVRQRVLDGEPVYKSIGPGMHPIPEYFDSVVCIKVKDVAIK